MKRFGAVGDSEIRGYILSGSGRAQRPTPTVETPRESECNTSECKHHHENIKLKEVLHSSLKEGNNMLLESTRVIDTLKEEYEKTQALLLEENDILRKELLEVKERLIQANQINTQEINEISNKLNQTEKAIVDSQKKEQQKPDVFTRLSQNTKSKKLTG